MFQQLCGVAHLQERQLSRERKSCSGGSEKQQSL